MMKFWYVAHPEPVMKRLKPALYWASDNGCFLDDGAVAACLSANSKDWSVAIVLSGLAGDIYICISSYAR